MSILFGGMALQPPELWKNPVFRILGFRRKKQMDLVKKTNLHDREEVALQSNHAVKCTVCFLPQGQKTIQNVIQILLQRYLQAIFP